VKCGEKKTIKSLYRGTDSIISFIATFLDNLFTSSKSIHERNLSEGRLEDAHTLKAEYNLKEDSKDGNEEESEEDSEEDGEDEEIVVSPPPKARSQREEEC
jgi:hypothetical protein